MTKYPKIQTVFKRDPATKHKTLLIGEYSLPEFGYLSNNMWAFTEKIDGTNIRVYYKDGNIKFGGRTDNAQIPATLVDFLQNHFLPRISVFESLFNDGICLYGEGYGAKIQKGGGNYRPDQSFILFDVLIGDMWLRRTDVLDVAAKLDLDFVPEIGFGTLHGLIDIAKDGFESNFGEFQAEGIVARPLVELRTRQGERIITKIKCKDFRK